jgi:hypothetical protein
MRILLDECVPRRLRQELPGHDVRTVQELGWSGKKNGELLQLMAGQGFEVLVTVDQSIRHQQNLQAAGVGANPLAFRARIVAESRTSSLNAFHSCDRRISPRTWCKNTIGSFPKGRTFRRVPAMSSVDSMNAPCWIFCECSAFA